MNLRVYRRAKLPAILYVLFLTSTLAIDFFAFGSETLPPLYLTIIVHQFW